jgi:hypothetical protein
MVTRIASEEQTLAVMSYFIQRKDLIFIFHGFTAEGAFPAYQGAFQNTMRERQTPPKRKQGGRSARGEGSRI